MGSCDPEVTLSGLHQLKDETKAARHDRSLPAYHHYEVASAAVQIAIALASAAIIPGMSALVWVAKSLSVVGIAFCGIGFFALLAVHLFYRYRPTEVARGGSELMPGTAVQPGPITSIEVTQ